MEDWLKDAAISLNVTQKVLETQYYMIDLPDLLEKKRVEQSRLKLLDLHNLIASNNRAYESEDYINHVNSLLKVAGFDDRNTTKFNREKMDRLHFITKRGANRTN
ncbi:hypothetical protein FZC76_21605 [Sutcliffiella horikoshii]|uniref:Uncharacterized protein n=1 Tax=Sutcliffiella horikoshii TaxID=79883 RepID=A0A5D4SCV4_9BACI|nr:hypothetical protein [Sutcliffiella horikoshii]TYS60471.1 hypothetical protein FZC76_21605 [Sutcliffiella horikoshii]